MCRRGIQQLYLPLSPFVGFILLLGHLSSLQLFFCSVQSIMRLWHLYSELSVYMEYFMSFGALKPILIRIWPHQNVRRDNTFRYRCSGHMM